VCGIAGMILPPAIEPWRERVERAVHALAHRGPDDRGIDVEGGVILGHTRLSIIDLSSAGHQPMRDGPLRLVFNGEIYNYRELRAELAGIGQRFFTDSDTEVLIKAWSCWGMATLERLVGMWAFALHDARSKQVVLSRDPFGIKPLYYASLEHGIAFASEIPALLAMGHPARANLDRVVDYVVTAATDHCADTFFAGVQQLSGGHNLVIDLRDGRTQLNRYYVIPETLPVTSASQFAAQLTDSVRLHLRSDVPVGTCLSGGLDSSTVAALASTEHSREPHAEAFAAVTAQGEDPGIDETRYARRVAEHCGLQWHVTRPTYENFAAGIDACLIRQGEPVGGASVFMQHCVMRKARDVGLKVMLDGQGADEALLGYERYYIAFFLHLLKRGRVGEFFHEFRLATRNSRLTLRTLAAYAVYFGSPRVRRLRLGRRSWFVDPAIRRRADETIDRMAEDFFDLGRLQRSELQQHCLPHLLRYEDRNSMGVSIEARVPFVTRPVLECALGLAPGDKIRDGYTKFALRSQAAAILPPEIAWRREKLGFEAPSVRWMHRHFEIARATVSRSHLLSALAPGGVPYEQLDPDLQWRIYNLAHWESSFGVTS
jgi:asparagine synthase (glutamine-hydrolysing)